MKKLGLIVNPNAGVGGRVGLKGTDGESIYRKAITLGARPEAQARALDALKVIGREVPALELLTCAGPMGEIVAQNSGVSCDVIEGVPADLRETNAADTRRATMEMCGSGVDLLLFAGGDGTARDISDTLASTVGSSDPMPVLGIPAGVKMHSGVFALTPRRAGEIVVRFLNSESEAPEVADAEVMDIDEEAFRTGRLAASLYGYLKTPLDSTGVQSTKSGALPDDGETPDDIARQVIEGMTEDTLYIIGPGTTTSAIPGALELPNTLLGVDVILNGELMVSDATESDLLSLTENKNAKIVVSVIGGQGYIFGRGNQQISPRLIRRVGRDNIIVVATRRKLLDLGGRPLLVDTGDSHLDDELSGYIKVVTGYRESHVRRVAC
ncbi:MAG: ATP-NAD kinase family protein [Chloroflexi bacterium]|nr:ATP-NAD kinase family protein [Chloroflexota bacterium]